ncbi:sensor histidine kinase [Lacrimispora sp.]|uniref:sensor histidine kinase n=1 Tax=Lacrimispora sp. TaxID=2719234 RepID=UPI002899DB37|nr:ATP-binding protein [Lacrimispora sp.]
MNKKRVKNIIFSFCILCGTLLICEVLYRNNFGYQNINIVMAMAIFIITAVTEGYIYGVSSAIIGVFTYDFLITSPRFGFSFTVNFPVTLIVLLLVVFTSSIITTSIKAQAEQARQKCQHAELLYSINRKLLSTRDLHTIIRYSMDYLKDGLMHSVAFFEDIKPDGKLNPYFVYVKDDVGIEYFIKEEIFYFVRLAADKQKALGDKDYGYFLPIMTQNVTYGVFAFSFKEKDLSKKQRMFLELIAEQTAQAFRMYRLVAEQQETKVMMETEKVKNSFLRSISHDLRTPLTSIIGASSTLLEEGNKIPYEVQAKLAEGIQNDSQWLLNMIENILSITKVQNNGMVIDKSEEIVEEVIEGVILTFRKRFPNTKITVNQPDNVILLPIDIMLISQVLTNILENTQRHAGGQRSDVTIEVKEEDDFVRFLIADTGPGIDPKILPMLFNFTVTPENPYKDSTRNLGIGLSICKTIIRAHGGEIYANNRPEGGAQFMFTIPLCSEK